MSDRKSVVSRRRLLQAGVLAGAALTLQRGLGAASPAPLPLIAKAIPATGEKLPVLGVGTNAFRDGLYDDLRAMLQRMHELGGTLIDTAASYGESEGVIGRALAELKLRDRFFISTKFNAAGGFGGMGGPSGRESLERSLQRLQTDHVDLLEVHRIGGLDELMPVMQELKQARKIRYLGVTTFRQDEHAQLVEAMRKYPLDFIQVDYSIANRDAATQVFPLALERKVAVMINVPLGGRRGPLFQEVAGRELPAWAADFDAASWSQFFLKYVVSHPAVTCAIPGSTKLVHLEDNQRAGLGRLPTAAQRKQMEEYWDRKG
jgi:aryl-alcohol dehydrogenase-like predicted oxidoreductase